MNVIVQTYLSESQIRRFLEELAKSALDPWVYAVYNDPSDEVISKGQLHIRGSEDPKLLNFSTRDYIHPSFQKFKEEFDLPDHLDVDTKYKSFDDSPNNMENILREYEPRRVILDGMKVYDQTKKYLERPYMFRGFAIGTREGDVEIFASVRDKRAGISSIRNREVKDLFLDALKRVI